jgi:TonB family protein
LPPLKAMKCLFPSRGTGVRRMLSVVLLVALARGVAGGVLPPTQRATPRTPLAGREQSLRRIPVHTAEFAPVYESLTLPPCREVRPPEALLTPDPPIPNLDDDLHVRVSFIVGADGRVESAFILNSGGRARDQAILRAVRRWRYRPALCNGVPTNMEAQVTFGRH